MIKKIERRLTDFSFQLNKYLNYFSQTNEGSKGAAASNTSKGWNNKSDKKKKTKKKGQATSSKTNNTSANKQSTPISTNKKPEKGDEKDSSGQYFSEI